MLQTCLMMLDTREDEERFVLLYERYKSLMKYVADRILKDRNLAEDAVHEAFFKIAKNFRGVGEIICPETKNFVVIITKRTALDMAQREQRHRQNLSLDEMTDEDGDGYMSPNFVERKDDSVFSEVNQKVLVQEIMGLPEKYRDVQRCYVHSRCIWVFIGRNSESSGDYRGSGQEADATGQSLAAGANRWR